MYTTPNENFRGMVWEPATEQEVVVLFGRFLPDLDAAIAINHARTPFPDCVAVATERDGSTKTLNIEFEYRSSSFRAHHSEWADLRASDLSARWLVVCWHSDLDHSQLKQLPGLEVMSLREELLKK